MNPIGKLLPGGLAGIGVLFLCRKIYAMHAELREEKECCERLRSQLRKQSVFLYEVTDELEDDLVSRGATLYPWKAKEMDFRLVKKDELSMVWNPPKTEIYRDDEIDELVKAQKRDNRKDT